ncbi:MAG: prepilin-type N-terminal cleavage/methylation domain-containing protein [Phycisphaerales bacterium]|nr:MAG: prepilin-type N-terminal cleavage/methylation domain-containing protein [Phycisphaerales bacterium]
MSLRRAGFTLVEVLVASTIAVFIAMVAAAALRTMTASSDAVDRNIDAAAEVRFAANMIARDLQNFYRTDDIEQTKLIGMLDSGSADVTASHIIFYTVNRIKARPDQPEGDIYEVEYYLSQDEEERSRLMRRLWPNPSEELEPGGMLTVIAEDIELFDIEYFDGEGYVYEWPEEMQSLPELITVTLAAKSSSLGIGPTESFIVPMTWAEGGDMTAIGSTGQTTVGTTE